MTGSGVSSSNVSVGASHNMQTSPTTAGKDEDENRAQTHADELPHEVDVVDRARHQIAGGMFGKKPGTLMLQMVVDALAQVVSDRNAYPANDAAADDDAGNCRATHKMIAMAGHDEQRARLRKTHRVRAEHRIAADHCVDPVAQKNGIVGFEDARREQADMPPQNGTL